MLLEGFGGRQTLDTNSPIVRSHTFCVDTPFVSPQICPHVCLPVSTYYILQTLAREYQCKFHYGGTLCHFAQFSSSKRHNTYLRDFGIYLCWSVLANTTRTLFATLKVTDKFSEATHCLKRQEMVDASNKVFIA